MVGLGLEKRLRRLTDRVSAVESWCAVLEGAARVGGVPLAREEGGGEGRPLVEVLEGRVRSLTQDVALEAARARRAEAQERLAVGEVERLRGELDALRREPLRESVQELRGALEEARRQRDVWREKVVAIQALVGL